MKQINSIRMENFICYKDQIINFEDESGTYVFMGDNNVGKSTLFNAVSWCLYETTPFKKSHNEVNVISDSRGANEATRVEIILTLDSKKYAITRTSTSTGSALDVSIVEGSNRSPVLLKKVELIEKFLPKSIQHLFIFDGELLKNLFDENTKEGLRQSVKVISEVNVLERSKRLIEDEINKLSRKASKNDDLTKEYDEIVASINTYSDQQKTSEKNIARLNKQIDELAATEDDLDKQIEANGKNDELIEKKNRLKDRVKELEIEISANESKLYEIIHGILPVSMLVSEITSFNDDIGKEIAGGELPAPIDPSELNKYIHDKICICGREIDTNAEAHMAKLKEDYEKVNRRKYISEAAKHYYHILDGIDKLHFEADDLRSEIAKQKQELNQTIADREECEDQLDKLQSTSSEGLKENRRDIKHALERAIDERGSEKTKLSTATSLIESFTNQRNQILNAITRESDQSGRIKFLRDCDKLLTETIRNVENNTVELLSQKIKDTFMALTGTTNYSSLLMNGSYEVSLISKNGNTRDPSSLGTGYHKMLGLSLIIALSDVLDNSDFPIMVDNPYDSISNEHQIAVSEYLGELSKTKQVIVTALENQNIDNLVKKSDVTRLFKVQQTSNISTVREIDHV